MVVVMVGMILKGKLTECTLYFFITSASAYTKNFIIITFYGHIVDRKGILILPLDILILLNFAELALDGTFIATGLASWGWFTTGWRRLLLLLLLVNGRPHLLQRLIQLLGHFA